MYVVFEGIDGSGKTSLIEKLVNDKELQKYNPIKKVEPFDKEFLEKTFLKVKNFSDFSRAVILTLAFAYDRSFLEFSDIYNKGLVLSDRSFVSSLAYQSIYLDINWIFEVNKYFKMPDLLIYLEVDIDVALERIKRRGEEIKFFEKEELLKKIKTSYNKVLDFLEDKGIKIVKIDSNKEFDLVYKEVKSTILDFLTRN